MHFIKLTWSCSSFYLNVKFTLNSTVYPFSFTFLESREIFRLGNLGFARILAFGRAWAEFGAGPPAPHPFNPLPCPTSISLWQSKINSKFIKQRSIYNLLLLLLRWASTQHEFIEVSEAKLCPKFPKWVKFANGETRFRESGRIFPWSADDSIEPAIIFSKH